MPLLDRLRSSSALRTSERQHKATASPKTPRQWHGLEGRVTETILCHCLTVLGQAVLFEREKGKYEATASPKTPKQWNGLEPGSTSGEKVRRIRWASMTRWIFEGESGI